MSHYFEVCNKIFVFTKELHASYSILVHQKSYIAFQLPVLPGFNFLTFKNVFIIIDI